MLNSAYKKNIFPKSHLNFLAERSITSYLNPRCSPNNLSLTIIAAPPKRCGRRRVGGRPRAAPAASERRLALLGAAEPLRAMKCPQGGGGGLSEEWRHLRARGERPVGLSPSEGPRGCGLQRGARSAVATPRWMRAVRES